MVYMLESHGDAVERELWPLVRGGFPNYERFWQVFVVPLTRRDIDKSIALVSGVDPLLEELCMAHYSVFYHMATARLLKAVAPIRLSEAVLFHLSAATEMTERLLHVVFRIKLKVTDPQESPLRELNEDEYKGKVADYWKDHYRKDFGRFLKSGRAVGAPLHNMREAGLAFFANTTGRSAFDSWTSLADSIRHYRNTVAHNPLQGRLITPTGVWVVKECKLSDYTAWSHVSGTQSLEYFLPLQTLLSDFCGQLEVRSNELWDHLIATVTELSKSDAYQAMWKPAVEAAKASLETKCASSPVATAGISIVNLTSNCSAAVASGSFPEYLGGSADAFRPIPQGPTRAPGSGNF